MSCGVDRRCGSDPVGLWLGPRPAATAPIGGYGPKNTKKKKKKKKKSQKKNEGQWKEEIALPETIPTKQVLFSHLKALC